MPVGPGAPTPSGLPFFGSVFGLTAYTAGGSTNATAVTSWINEFTTSANNTSSVMLPPGWSGAQIWIINDAALAFQVFGNTTNASDTISAHGSSTQVASVAQASASAALYVCWAGQYGNTNSTSPAQWRQCLFT